MDEKTLLEQILKRVDEVCKQQDLMRADVDELRKAASPTAASAPEPESMLAKVARECGGDISASQEEILANSSFLGGDNNDEEEEEVFSTPPDDTQQQDDPVTMCTLPFTPTPSPAPPAKKPRVCIRGARISTPTPSPNRQQPEQQQLPEQQQPQPEQPTHLDTLVRAVLMTPTRTTSNSERDPVKDFIELARQKGIF